MSITLEQAKALQAIAEHGSISRAAAKLRKRHSALVYTIRTLERETGLKLVDSSQYRSRLTLQGERFLQACQRLIDAEREVAQLCKNMETGWEPEITIVHEGGFPTATLIRTLLCLNKKEVPTRFRLQSAHHQGVEEQFRALKADIMISFIPPQKAELMRAPLTPVPFVLVAHSSHPLVRARGKRSLSDLRKHPFLTVMGSSPKLNLPTNILENGTSLEVGDFLVKREALLNGLGFGWMPEFLIAHDLAEGRLKPVSWSRESRHMYFPFVYFRESEELGKAANAFLEDLLVHQTIPDCCRC